MSAQNPFASADAVAGYAEGPPKLVPGHRDLLRMAGVLLAEAAPADGRILVLGAGGGLEMRAYATAQPGWRLTGVDPSAAMLDIARQTLGDLTGRAELIDGTVEAAPDGPFDGASCILTMPFVPAEDRLPTLRALHRRLRPGARLVMAHHSFPRGPETDALWMGRFSAFAALSGISLDEARQKEMLARLTILPPEAEEDLLAEAGFRDVTLFYAALAFRGWVATA
ncbi:MAG: class I SAM-dependent methyltransferase [Paracoccaceae bacterium]